MKNYAVRLLFQFIIENESRKIYEESIRLFYAKSHDEAFEKAEQIAKCESFEYTNVYSQKVTYKLYDLIESFIIYDKMNFADGTEVFSTIFEMKNPSDDPIEQRFKSCSVDDLYVLRNDDFLIKKYGKEN